MLRNSLSILASITVSFSFALNAQGAAFNAEASRQVISEFKKVSVIKEFSESGDDAVVDNDGDANNFQEQYSQSLQSYVQFLGDAGLLVPGAFKDTYYKNVTRMSFEKVSKELSECMESEFDMVILANTAASGKGIGAFPAAQRIKYVRRARPGSGIPLFERNPQLGNMLVGFNRQAISRGQLVTQKEMISAVAAKFGEDSDVVAKSFDKSGAILMSSGKGGNSGILTFSGLFRLNPNKPEFGKGMIHNMYSDYKYMDDSGAVVRDSGLAIHGTPKIENLGRRDSHGCLRIHPKLAGIWRDFVYKSKHFKSDKVLNLNNASSLPPEDVKSCQSGYSPGYKVLVMIYDGYSSQAL